MKVFVIGLGSMGRRRIRLMKTLDSVPDIIGIDLMESRRNQVEAEYGIRTCSSIDEAMGIIFPDAAFVCSSPASHGKIVMECIKRGINVFMEINLIGDWYDAAIRLATERHLTLFLSSTFLYRKEIEYITAKVRGESVNYIYHSGQYLPDWHPWESYKDFFVSDKKTNACREILAIELPWLISAFGAIENLHVMKGKNSSLDIDFNDNYMISLQHASGCKGCFCQDILSRRGLRRLEVYSEKIHLFWEGTPQSLSFYDLEKKQLSPVSLYDKVDHALGYSENIVENAYRDEVLEFFDVLEGNASPRYSLRRDKAILKLIDDIEGGVYG